MVLGNQLHRILTFRLTLGDTWGGFRGHLGTLGDTWEHLGTLGVGLGDTWGAGTWGGFRDVPDTLSHLLQEP